MNRGLCIMAHCLLELWNGFWKANSRKRHFSFEKADSGESVDVASSDNKSTYLGHMMHLQLITRMMMMMLAMMMMKLTMMMMLGMMQMLGQLVLAHWSCIWLLSNVNSASASKRIRYNMEHRSLTQMPASASTPVSASAWPSARTPTPTPTSASGTKLQHDHQYEQVTASPSFN